LNCGHIAEESGFQVKAIETVFCEAYQITDEKHAVYWGTEKKA